MDNSGDRRDSLIFELKFQDGDGDLGLRIEESGPPFDYQISYVINPFTLDTIGINLLNPRYYNFLAEFYKKNPSGSFDLVRDFAPGDPNLLSAFPYHGRFPILNEGLAKGPIDGTLFVRHSAEGLQRRGSVGAFFAADTIRIHIYIFDREGNQSNVIEIGPLNFPAYVQ